MLFIPHKILFSFLKYLHFCPDVFGHVGKRLDKKAKVNFKVLPNISRSKSNQIMKFGQLIEYNVRNLSFYKQSNRKQIRETSSRSLFVF